MPSRSPAHLFRFRLSWWRTAGLACLVFSGHSPAWQHKQADLTLSVMAAPCLSFRPQPVMAAPGVNTSGFSLPCSPGASYSLPWRRSGLTGSSTAEMRRCFCPEASAALGKMAAVGNAVSCGTRSDGTRPGEQPKSGLQPRGLLAAGPALIANGDELVAAVWPYRRLPLLRRLTVLPFAGLLYPAWLGAAAAGCWGWGSSWTQIPEAALLVLATICLAHALTVLSGHWSVHAHCALTCTPVSARASRTPARALSGHDPCPPAAAQPGLPSSRPESPAAPSPLRKTHA